MAPVKRPYPTVRIGAHVDARDPIAEARARGTDLVQIFLGSPQSYKGPVVAYEGGAQALKEAAREAGITVYVHAPYIINVATTNNRVRIPSRKLLQAHVSAAAEIGAAAVIVHGGHVSDASELETGYDNWRKAIEATQLHVPVLIENTAGGEHAMSRHLEALDRVFSAIGAADNADQVGFCLDTCHAHAAGIDLGTAVERVRAVTGRIDLVHANDSRDTFGSGADRHANFGEGQIDHDAFVRLIGTAAAPVIAETPGDVAAHVADFAWLKQRL